MLSKNMVLNVCGLTHIRPFRVLILQKLLYSIAKSLVYPNIKHGLMIYFTRHGNSGFLDTLYETLV